MSDDVGTYILSANIVFHCEHVIFYPQKHTIRTGSGNCARWRQLYRTIFYSMLIFNSIIWTVCGKTFRVCTNRLIFYDRFQCLMHRRMIFLHYFIQNIDFRSRLIILLNNFNQVNNLIQHPIATSLRNLRWC